MINDERMMNVVEDHALCTSVIDAICCSIENGTEMPNYIPVCNDPLLSDQLSLIAETITKLRGKLL